MRPSWCVRYDGLYIAIGAQRSREASRLRLQRFAHAPSALTPPPPLLQTTPRRQIALRTQIASSDLVRGWVNEEFGPLKVARS